MINYPSIAKFQQFVQLKDYRPPTKKEYVRYVRKCAEHFQCDPLTLTQDQLRAYFLFLRQDKHPLLRGAGNPELVAGGLAKGAGAINPFPAAGQAAH